MENNELNLFIDEYVEFKTDFAVASALCEVYGAQVQTIANEINFYRDKPEFVEVMARLQIKYQQAVEQYEQVTEHAKMLEKKQKGFEGRRHDTLSELSEEKQLQ